MQIAMWGVFVLTRRHGFYLCQSCAAVFCAARFKLSALSVPAELISQAVHLLMKDDAATPGEQEAYKCDVIQS